MRPAKMPSERVSAWGVVGIACRRLPSFAELLDSPIHGALRIAQGEGLTP